MPRRLTIEQLECRTLLTATADIIFLVDESHSTSPGALGLGLAVHPWVSLIAPKLEQKLVDRGFIGNRYGLILFGTGDFRDFDTPRARAIRVPENSGSLMWPVTSMNAALEQTLSDQNGDREDGWEALSWGIGVDGIASEYDFRPDAAVDFILVSDHPSTVIGFDWFGRDHVNNMGGETSTGAPLFSAILDEMRAVNIDTGMSNPKVLSDAVLTTVGDFTFDTSEFGVSNGKLLGVDVHRLPDELPIANPPRSINVDLNNADPADDLQINKPDEWAVFTRVDSEGDSVTGSTPAIRYNDDSVQVTVHSGADTWLDVGYAAIRTAFNNPCGATPSLCDEPPPPPDQYNPFSDAPDGQVVGQDDFRAEDYAFLTWEARGTTWEYGVMAGEFNGWLPSGCITNAACDLALSSTNFKDINHPQSTINMFNQAFIDDTLEKILLQRVDFDSILGVPPSLASVIPPTEIKPGQISTADIDVMTYYILNPPVDDPSTPGIDEAERPTRALDLNGVGGVTQADRDLLVNKVFATWFGDANFDGLYTSSDFTKVFQAGEYEDGVENNSGWSEGDWDGDLDFLSADFVKAFNGGGYEWQTNTADDDLDGSTNERSFTDAEGYKDTNGDKIEDFRPVWGKHILTGEPVFYRPTWGA